MPSSMGKERSMIFICDFQRVSFGAIVLRVSSARVKHYKSVDANHQVRDQSV